jgi:hypothetical protein
MPRPVLSGTAILMSKPSQPDQVRVCVGAVNPVFVDGVNVLIGPAFTMNGIAATATPMSVIVNVMGLPVILEGSVVTCADGYVGTFPVTGITPNFM